MAISVGIIGCGGIARSHAEGYAAAGVPVAAVADINPKAAKALAKSTGATVYPDYQALLNSGEVQAVSICTPPVAHGEAAQAALRAGVHVLCEKPMALDIAGAYWMRYALGHSQALLMPAFRHRFLPAIVALRKLIASDAIGEPVLFNNMFCGPAFEMEHTWFTKKAVAGGGCVLDTSSHSVDLFRFLIGEIVEQHVVAHRHFQTTDVEDAGILTVKAASGAVGAMHSAFVAGSGAAFIDIMGTKGRVWYHYFEPTALRWRTTKDKDWRTQAVEESWGFAEEIQHFLGATQGKHPLAVTAEDGVRAMEVICMAYTESAAAEEERGMKKIGFIDYYIDEWHANNYPRWIRESSRAKDFEVALAWQEMQPADHRTLEAWCEEQRVRAASSREQVIEECDCLVVLSPDNPERHEDLCDLPLRCGKPVYVDKTFSPDFASAQRLFAKAEQHHTPMYSSSALRYVEGLERAMQELAGQRVDFVATGGPGEWGNYSVHQLEPLVMLLGTGASRMMQVGNAQARLLILDYPDGRRGAVLQTPEHPFQFRAQLGARTVTIGEMGDFFPGFIEAMLAFFEAGEVPVPKAQTLEIMALREAGLAALAAPDQWVAVPR